MQASRANSELAQNAANVAPESGESLAASMRSQLDGRQRHEDDQGSGKE